jgi:hypothetical protein
MTAYTAATMVNLETSFDDVVPLAPEEAKRAVELAQLLQLSSGARRQEPGPLGPWEVLLGERVVFTAPHEVPHIRDGEDKIAEKDTGALAFALAGYTGGSAIVTAPGQTGDPNWDIDNPFIMRASALAAGGASIDIHMMRPRGVELCIGLGPNPKLGDGLWQPFVAEAIAGGLRVSVNWPFGANPRTVTGQLQQRGRNAIQLELSWDCFDPDHPAMPRAWSSLGRAARRLIEASAP